MGAIEKVCAGLASPSEDSAHTKRHSQGNRRERQTTPIDPRLPRLSFFNELM